MHPRHYFLLPFFLVCSIRLFAQSPVYNYFDVDSPATPLGGFPMLETFLAVNVQKPFLAQVANVAGKVLIEAVVEPNGYVSDVRVARSLRPDCDREAMRVMRLFNAWKPAQKTGKPVPQVIRYPVVFSENEPINYKDGKVFTYYDADWKETGTIKNAKYTTEMPVDTITGIPTGDLVTNELYLDLWSEASRTALLKQKLEDQKALEEPMFTVGYKPDGKNWHGLIYTLTADNSLVYKGYTNDEMGQSVQYYKNGVVEYVIQNDNKKITKWYSNGLLQYVRTGASQMALFSKGYYQLIDAWDSTGIQQVKKGKGHMVYQSIISSRHDSTKTTLFTEEGSYKEGLQDGLWKGIAADSSFSYQEQYDKGKDLGGEAVRNGKSVAYRSVMKIPEFVGGSKEMYKFLNKTIRYPRESQRQHSSGRVFVSFTVRTDGSLCNYTILKGLDPYLDEESLRVVKLMNTHWLPGYERGEAVEIKYNLPISFQLEKAQPTGGPNIIGAYYMFRPFLR